MVDELIPQVAGLYKIDLDRVCLTGISMGGYGAWMTAINFPEQFAAIAPICGGGEPGRASALRNVPVWTFHGAKDPLVPVSATEAMVNALKKAGG
jgi:predicted peptidase